MNLEVGYTTIIWQLLGAVDRDHRSLDVVEVETRCNAREGLEWLQRDLDLDLTVLSRDQGAQINDQFQSLAETVDSSHRFGVEHEGYRLLIAYCAEGLQRSVERRHRR